MALSKLLLGFPGGSNGKESACNAGDPGLIPEFRRSPGERNGYLLQYSCMENSMDRGAFWLQSRGSQRVRRDQATNKQLIFSLSLFPSFRHF